MPTWCASPLVADASAIVEPLLRCGVLRPSGWIRRNTQAVVDHSRPSGGWLVPGKPGRAPLTCMSMWELPLQPSSRLAGRTEALLSDDTVTRPHQASLGLPCNLDDLARDVFPFIVAAVRC